jgi:phosphoglycerate dehydrogenase-like enzyme
MEKELPGLNVHVCSNSREFLERLPEAEAVVVWFFKKEWLPLAPKLRWIATPAAGRDWIDAEPSDTLEITHGGFHGPMIAESVVGAIFYFCKVFQLSRDAQKQRRWERVEISRRITSLRQSRVAILGFGNIGGEIGRKLKPFGCFITGIKRTPREPPDYFAAGDRVIAAADMMEALRATDHLIMVLPGGAATDGMFTRKHFHALPRHCHVYNVGRGNVYREEDMVEALSSGAIAGAYLDVFAREPLPESSPLWTFDNVLIQPHLSAAAPQYLDLYVDELIARIKSQR